MDYLDPKKQFRQRVTLLVGYVLVAVAISIATLVLVYQAYGFNIGKNGTVIQNGLVFFSSHPNPASIYINGALRPETTNTRLILPSGIYTARLTDTGYRDWSRTITVNGGQVEHFDYPFLFPTNLTSQKLADYTAAPGLMTQSPDKRWLIIEKPGSMTDFDLYDLKSSAKPVVSSLTLPNGLLSKATTAEAWQLVEWADDNQHILLEHIYNNKTEYILVDRANPSQSVNLNNSFGITSALVSLNNKKFDAYYIYDATKGDLSTSNLSNPSVTPVVNRVLAFKSYSSDTILYATSDTAQAGKVLIKLKVGNQSYDIRSLPESTNYLIDLTTYSGVLYVAAGSNSDNRVYIYQDPVSQLAKSPNQAVTPIWVLHVPSPNYLSFSSNAQFIVTENGSNYAAYDIENKLGYLYSNQKLTLDTPQPHASWMDGDRITYVSQGKLIVQDYDNNNRQTLVAASPNYLPGFSPDYKYLFTLSPSTSTGQLELNQTPLVTTP